MHVIINGIGSAGDINPFVPIACKLKEAGHRVDFLASPYFEEKIRKQNINFLPLGTLEDYHSALNNPDVWKLKKAFALVWEHVTKSTMLAYDAILKNYTPGETVLIGSTLATGARFVQEKFGVPMASVHLSPALMLSSYDTPQSPTSPIPEWAPRQLRSLWIKSFVALVLDPISKPPLNKLRAQLGLAPVSNIITKWIHSPDLVICAFPDWFAAVQPDWPPNSINCNFPLFDSSYDAGLSEELEEFLAAGEPPVVITAGTGMAFPGKFLQTGMRAAQITRKRCLLVCNYEDEVPRNLPDGVMHVRYANFHTLFQRAGMVIHHGGIGTSAMAMACGCPQVIVPFAHDQFDNARRLENLGVGWMVLDHDKDSAWADGIIAMRAELVKHRCEGFKEKFEQSEAGEDQIVRAITERLMK